MDKRQVEQIVALQQRVLDGMDYLAENLREHVIWGVLPFKEQSRLAGERQHLAVMEAQQSRIQSQSVVVFTFITLVFLPLSFFTSYFGLNFRDTVSPARNSAFFWEVSIPVTGGVIALVAFVIKLIPRPVIHSTLLDIEQCQYRQEKATAVRTMQRWWKTKRL